MNEFVRVETATGQLPEEVDNTKSLLLADLASLLDASNLMQQLHWNVKGMHFQPIHELLGKIYSYLADTVDSLAERIMAVGLTAQANTEFIITNSYITPISVDRYCCYTSTNYAKGILLELRNKMLSNTDILDISDKVTSNFYQEIIFELDKFLYFLNSHLLEHMENEVRHEEET